MLCEAIAFDGASDLLVVLHELRARVRAVLGLWTEASEDVRVALKGLEQGEGYAIDDADSDEERAEASVRRTRQLESDRIASTGE